MLDLLEGLVEVVGPSEAQADIVALYIVLYVLCTLYFREVLCEIFLSVHYGKGDVIIEPLYALAVLP